MSPIKSLVKEQIEKYEWYRYHHISNTIAQNTLQNLEKEKGKFPITLKKQSDAYAREILGWKGFSPWLYVYSHFSEAFKEGWIPDNFYGKVVIPKIQGDYGKISYLKPITHKLLEEKPCPDLGYLINGRCFDNNYNPVLQSDFKNLLFKNTDKVICKLDQSCQGKGVYVFQYKEFEILKILELGNCVIQKYIQQHKFFNTFTTDSVATIRLTTVIDCNFQVSLRAAYLRLGRKHNTHVSSEDHIRISINMDNGTLNSLGYLPNWHKIEQHPDTLEKFDHKLIPNFEECKILVERLHRRVPMVQAIGWDLIVDTNNKPIVMEWNGYSNDIKFSEASQGPCFKDLAWNKLRI
ncbi:sugar-transfer associated ATP-grasp domain-containing protein [Cellulophaga baltica]|uniref:sugar-transfer associated ATP-grasp domain-containing protein n=1 Tax=Cellulophaga baltica TaxID=76594 RepID=UPI002494DDBC|nr:sugar-transfer associated ATP-grasp domain-containing protein [Cellulophaga baltica]